MERCYAACKLRVYGHRGKKEVDVRVWCESPVCACDRQVGGGGEVRKIRLDDSRACFIAESKQRTGTESENCCLHFFVYNLQFKGLIGGSP